MNFVVIREFCSNPIYQIVTKFGDYDKIHSLLIRLQQNKRDYYKILFRQKKGMLILLIQLKIQLLLQRYLVQEV